jgi:hypothetical protein
MKFSFVCTPSILNIQPDKDDATDGKRLITGNSRINANVYIESALEEKLIGARERYSDIPDWNDKTKHRARVTMLIGDRIRSILWFLWRFYVFGLNEEQLKKLSEAYQFPYLTARAVYPWFIQSHLQALISLKYDSRVDSSLEQERRILGLLVDIGLLDRQVEKNGKIDNILLKPNAELKDIVDEYLDRLNGWQKTSD